ncbi:MAG: hypothetical protein K0R39_4257 [Symbiobacteriaceae bacterium]|jgi:hypothetical protein|nr:hypothetical protein [Symbiobacteriaceae bacterium]
MIRDNQSTIAAGKGGNLMARLRELVSGCRVITRSGFNGTVVGTARLVDVNVVLVNLDLLTGEERNPVVVFPENLTPLQPEALKETTVSPKANVS